MSAFLVLCVSLSGVYAGDPVNLQALKGMDKKAVMKEMAAWNKALGVKCLECHVSMKELDKEDKPAYGIARKMVALTKTINEALGSNGMTCYGCHRGSLKMPASAANNAVKSDNTDPGNTKTMGKLTMSTNKFLKGAVPGVKVKCGTCHHGEGKVPMAP